MYNFERYSKQLEFDKILQLLAEHTTILEAKDAVLSIIPSSSLNDAAVLMKNTEDAYLLTSRFSAPSFGRAGNVAPLINRAAAGGILSMKELLNIAETLRIVRGVSDWRKNISEEKATSIDEYFGMLFPNKYFEDRILSCIKNEDEMHDNASAELSVLRRKIASASANIKSRLQKIVRDGSKNKFLQDAIITQRDGRYVVPVKSEFKSEVSGIVHDSSASGATLFIEPMLKPYMPKEDAAE